MHEVRQIIQRLRLGEKNRKVARAQRVGRDTVANIRRIAAERGWLDAADCRRVQNGRVCHFLENWRSTGFFLVARFVFMPTDF